VTAVEGSYVGAFAPGQSFSGSFVYDTDEAQADPGAITTPSVVPGHEFTSFYEFPSPPYHTDLSFPEVPGVFNANSTAVVVNNDLALTAEEINGVVSDGIYDWIELLGSTAIGICLEPGGLCAPDEYSPADGEGWTIAIIGDPSWFSDGSVVPDDLPVAPSSLIVGFEFDQNGVETGAVFASVSYSVSDAAPTVPTLGPLGLIATACFLCFGIWRFSRVASTA
jgi:hypothetical protein